MESTSSKAYKQLFLSFKKTGTIYTSTLWVLVRDSILEGEAQRRTRRHFFSSILIFFKMSHRRLLYYRKPESCGLVSTLFSFSPDIPLYWFIYFQEYIRWSSSLQVRHTWPKDNYTLAANYIHDTLPTNSEAHALLISTQWWTVDIASSLCPPIKTI